MKYLIALSLVALFSSACSTMSIAERKQQCVDEPNILKSRQCTVALGMSLNIPVKCIYMELDARNDKEYDDSIRCRMEAREQILQMNEAAIRQREQYDYEHRMENAESISQSLNSFGNNLKAPAASAPARSCKPTLAHYDGYGNPVPATQCH